ncbi:MAG: hypothetical protein HYT72_03730 [Candidatus Aenigmarchaeota archaeon]|nr:hypothetical protein [Candidatus Aenigmarchaeota archaeon]
MIIENILIEDKVKEKVLKKHNVTAEEIKNVLLRNPIVLRAKKKRYLAIGFDSRYLTIVFEYARKTANIVTTYPSSEWQKKLYKSKRE